MHNPLISVIIPCYNLGHLLQDALDSVFRQTYENTEIIVIDDGSTDDTKTVALRNTGVRYFYQHNQGPSAARNVGLQHFKGECVVFLDADDYLYDDALAINYSYLAKNEQLAFVSGSHDKVFVQSGDIVPVVKTVPAHHYLNLLKGNYIGMHAAVMYRRWVFDEFKFDSSIRGCEEYDLYLKIARKYLVLHHPHKIAAYRFHKKNSSHNIPLMLNTAIRVLESQEPHLRNSAEKSAYTEGLRNWKQYYVQELYANIQGNSKFSATDYYTLLKNLNGTASNSQMLSSVLITFTKHVIKKIPSGRVRKKLISLLPAEGTPPFGKVKLGDFHQSVPFSTQFGYDRGGPVDRYYIENFLSNESLSVRGRVLEIGDNSYTMFYGSDRITKSDILHVNDSNPHATIIGDISNAPHIPDNAFDCIILTQTLHLIYNFKDALHTCHRILKPGGTLLLTVPGITPIDHGEWEDVWYWSFTDKSMKRLMEETFPGSNAEVYPYGNVLTASAFLYGMGLPELSHTQLDFNDPHFQVTITVKATKAIPH
ncbi:glycosyltransferase [Pontibacter indicus]|uniref:Glycosyltransferase involved in cell wall bisynthesis n=1 Tax=Pontibacter indicus TaxID=1317125 RepID=A0A1R3XP98_9BACT|nr:glycosyltransferase [Pontibacter indicus]SIT93718.1 Glycosyltransferase involved in cell wall bisynthesis [Pontibacter indicus]